MIKLEWLEGDFTVAKEKEDQYYIGVFDNNHWSGAILEYINREKLIKIRDAINEVLEK